MYLKLNHTCTIDPWIFLDFTRKIMTSRNFHLNVFIQIYIRTFTTIGTYITI